MQEFNKQKIFWHSRRGMLELDLLLVPFATEAFSGLSNQDQLLYSDLLEQEDQDLFAWLMQQSEPEELRFKHMIQLILAHNNKSYYTKRISALVPPPDGRRVSGHGPKPR